MKTKLSILVALLLLPALAWAQESDAYARFAKAAGFESTLFRGARPEVYPFAYNGHFYWKSPTFKEGRVLFNGKWYGPMMMNVNAHLQEVMLKPAGNRPSMSVSSDLVDEFYIGGVHFYNLEKKGYDGVQSGFYEVVFEGRDMLLKRIVKIQMENAANNNGMPIGYDDPNYKDHVLKFFQYNRAYYFLRDGKLVQFKGKAALKGFYKDRKKDINAFVKSHGLRQADFEPYCKAVMDYVENY